MEIQMKWLARKVGRNSNSILHMVGERGEGRTAEDATQSPALQLRDDLLLFERIKEICSAYSFKHINSEGKTAEGLFADNNEELRHKAEEWLRETAKNCTIVAVLIVTVAFAAAYTVPGGSNPNSGVPLLINQPFFVIFTIADVLSLTFTLTSVIVFLSILTSPFRLNDFKQSLPQQLLLGFTLLIFSVSMMMLAFAATIILMIRNKEQWTKIALYTVAFFPVTVFAISYLPLYISLLPTVKYSLKQIRSFLPEFDWVLIRSSITNKFKCSRNFPRKIPSNYTEIPVTSASCPTIPHTSPSVV
ncbi:unnamed protein product [Ilex paraguariensis]|uniref:PGG domain-containing protein n=1 Tax=Ilex paraguariensis TaxID=185542 RepID=A0ABC8S823_9AQUA